MEKIYKLEVKTWIASDTIFGTKEIILPKLDHLFKNSIDEDVRKQNIYNCLFNTDKPFVSSYFSINYAKQNGLNVTISEVYFDSEPIAPAYTSSTKHSLLLTFPEDFRELDKILQNDFIGNEGLECVDNIRICVKGNAEGEKLYEEAFNSGCCGYIDKDYIIGDKTYRIGCNHGH